MEKLNNKQKVYAFIIIMMVLVIGILFYYFNQGNNKVNIITSDIIANNVNSLTESNELENAKEEIFIHITGNVKNEGIILIEQGARIIDVIEAAGGAENEADLSKVNLAYQVSDGQKIYIPSIYDEEEISYVSDNSGDNVIVDGNSYKGGEKVNINTANQTELETLTGIGPSTAAKIIQYRNSNGKYNNIEDIKNVNGIGDAKYEGIKDFIIVK